MIRRIVRIAGFAVFVGAFFLPAVRLQGTGPLAGWVCAEFALAPVAALLHPAALMHDASDNSEILLLFCGWVNPLVLIFLFFCIWRRFVWTRGALAAAVLACIASTWLFLAQEHFAPLIGHFLWIAGIFAMLLADVIPSRASRGRTESTAQSG